MSRRLSFKQVINEWPWHSKSPYWRGHIITADLRLRLIEAYSAEPDGRACAEYCRPRYNVAIPLATEPNDISDWIFPDDLDAPLFEIDTRAVRFHKGDRAFLIGDEEQQVWEVDEEPWSDSSYPLVSLSRHAGSWTHGYFMRTSVLPEELSKLCRSCNRLDHGLDRCMHCRYYPRVLKTSHWFEHAREAVSA